MSMSMPCRCPCSLAYFCMSSHCGLIKAMFFEPLPCTPYIGEISSVPSPALAYCSIFHFRFSSSTAEPIHHQRLPAFVSFFTSGHFGWATLCATPTVSRLATAIIHSLFIVSALVFSTFCGKVTSFFRNSVMKSTKNSKNLLLLDYCYCGSFSSSSIPMLRDKLAGLPTRKFTMVTASPISTLSLPLTSPRM